MLVSGKVALITGAGGGIGRACAFWFAKEGAAVVVNDIDPTGGRETVQLIQAAGGQALFAQADISLEQEVIGLMKQAAEWQGRLDVLVNNAGLDLVTPIDSTKMTDWDRLHAVDLRGSFLCCRHAVPYLRATRRQAKRSDSPSIINIASVHAIGAVATRSAYAAAKSGLVGLTRALALELGPDGIRVNAVLPGYIRTDIWNVWLTQMPNSDQIIERIARLHPLGRFGTPDDVAKAVVFLASEYADFITATTLVVDGGLMASVPLP